MNVNVDDTLNVHIGGSMQFASVRDFRLHAAAILERAGKEENVVVTRRGKPVAILIPTDEDMFEDVLRAVAGARLMAATARLQEHARKAGTRDMSLGQINAEIRKVRQRRRA